MAMGPTPHVPTNSNTQKERTMRRLSIAFALSTLLLVTICSAQQPAQNTPANPAQHEPPLFVPYIYGSGTTNSVGMFTGLSGDGHYDMGSSSMFVNPGVGALCVPPPPASPAGCVTNYGSIDVEGSVDGVANGYQILAGPGENGGTVLSIGNTTDANLFVGIYSGSNNNNMGGMGANHTFLGNAAGMANTTGMADTFVGYHAGTNNMTGNYNVFVGAGAGPQNVTFSYNTFTGYRSGYISGPTSCGSDSPANYNTFYGFKSGYNNTCGADNVFLGANAGLNNATGNFDIYIENQGASSGIESGTIRIGNSNHTTTYIAGINNSMGTPNPPIQVACVDSVGLLFGATFGTQCTTSSRRFKEQVRDMGDSTNNLMKLRPVTFFYKPEYANGEHTLEYGLIAEEVAKVYPELVAYDKDGQPYTVRYQYIATMLLNEVQKQYHRAEAQADLIKAQQQEIDGLKQQLQVQNATLEERLSRLEALAQVERAAAH
jgi:hypothetical protein